ncbi:RING finger and CHY zinc finger domain-containing protein 1 isoform X1 [Glossina fuscipes]|uniref:RING finger and CHY zinc finger domain-containing protein 1 isoform X1 n=1 Tax=Glossina fuscipes TaxID=7396 RepID=A0A9C5ZDI0_9MUSC|nr:RING finger and CHY zinc finger domain-containing protein 1 isoform X1 [Glossina fuscipes]
MAQLPVNKRSHASLSQQLSHSAEQAYKSEVNRIASSSSTLSTVSSERRRPMLRKSLSTPSLRFIEDSNVSVKTSSLIDDQYHQRAKEDDQKTNSSENAPMQADGCVHYKRFCLFVTPCCKKFYKCRFCHDENESHHFDRKTLTELICAECNARQKVQERCQNCGTLFGKYTCLICNLFDDLDKQQYHCAECGICRIGGRENFFHCKVCNMCLPMQMKTQGHRCIENISRSHCPVCLGDIHTSRIPCHIPYCGHLLHGTCFDQLLEFGHYTCPVCQMSLIDMTTLWEYLDIQAKLIPTPEKYEKERFHIFCNDCHKTSKAKFHFIGLKCCYCGAYNTTQNVQKRLSLVAAYDFFLHFSYQMDEARLDGV